MSVNSTGTITPRPIFERQSSCCSRAIISLAAGRFVLAANLGAASSHTSWSSNRAVGTLRCRSRASGQSRTILRAASDCVIHVDTISGPLRAGWDREERRRSCASCPSRTIPRRRQRFEVPGQVLAASKPRASHISDNYSKRGTVIRRSARARLPQPVALAWPPNWLRISRRSKRDKMPPHNERNERALSLRS